MLASNFRPIRLTQSCEPPLSRRDELRESLDSGRILGLV